jgi:hypothetical protein
MMASIAGKGAVAGGGNLSGNDTGGRDFIDTGFPVTDDALLESYDIAIGTALGAESVKLKVWRVNGSNYDFIGESQTSTGLAGSTVHNIVLDTPVNVLTGDLIGVHITETSNPSLKADSSSGKTVKFQAGDSNTPQLISGFADLSNLAMSMEAFGTIGGGITLTGTAVPTQTEATTVSGGGTIILTLAGDTFVTGTSSLDGIAGGSDSDIAASGTNWDSLIKTDLDNTNVVLSVGDTVATITLPAYASYDIPGTETITWTIPAASLTTSSSAIIATPTHTVTAIAADSIGATSLPFMSAVTIFQAGRR